ncbi:hypothetical protein BCAR13_410030 [Paraburkholderia caribensis]|nr:hypothetical protein BCAR13_410030 [Paraburkholderia caribensis]
MMASGRKSALYSVTPGLKAYLRGYGISHRLAHRDAPPFSQQSNAVCNGPQEDARTLKAERLIFPVRAAMMSAR